RLPNRLDVVVFKFPGDGDRDGPWPNSGPFKDHVPLNYIKRLLGLPGETIAIYQGKIYILSPDGAREFKIEYPDDLQRDGLPRAGEELLERKLELGRKPFMHKDDERAVALFNKEKALPLADNTGFKILCRPPEVLLAMRRIVYDNDHPATDP